MSLSVVKCSWVKSVVKCSEVLHCSDGSSNKVSNIIGRHIANMKLPLICTAIITLFIFFRFYFFINIWLYSCLIL